MSYLIRGRNYLYNYHLRAQPSYGWVSVALLFNCLCFVVVFCFSFFFLCHVCPLLPVSLDCQFLMAPPIFIVEDFCFVCLRHMSFVSHIASVSGLSILDFPFDFLNRLFSSINRKYWQYMASGLFVGHLKIQLGVRLWHIQMDHIAFNMQF